MKRKTTKEILAESFRELAESKSVDRISVQEIVDNCDYSTATFYRHFKDKYDLIAWAYTTDTRKIMERSSKKRFSKGSRSSLPISHSRRTDTLSGQGYSRRKASHFLGYSQRATCQLRLGLRLSLS